MGFSRMALLMGIKRKQLFSLSSSEFRIPFHIDLNGTPMTIRANNVPLICWPNGKWCFEANSFLLKRFELGLSRRTKGGTLAADAFGISEFLRFCYNNKISFSSFTDNEFCFFIKTLSGEKISSSSSISVRSSNSVINIGRKCLGFLEHIGQLHQLSNFVGPTGRIIAHRQEINFPKASRGGKPLTRICWHHRAFPPASPSKKRLPISSVNIDKIKGSVQESSEDPFIRKRRYILIKLLEITGARRYEIRSLTVASVLKAATMENPHLTFVTAKKSSEKFREIPISRNDLSLLLQYVNKNRAPQIRKTCGSANDCGFFLISATTGRQLNTNTLTQEISLLAKAAGIEEQACPHLFRHRFITKLFITMIEQHEIENPDEFRRNLFEVEQYKRKISELTGHKNLDALTGYIDLAFAERSCANKYMNIAFIRDAVDAASSALKSLVTSFDSSGLSTDDILKFSEIVSNLDRDLSS